ncbi:DUF4328 domain-containing protein [Actinoalloteichus sp. AHMU CJ021]|uniref:DUF4328 domain-containing protein n=2 Tax=Actinoalloteichus cyanogriseus TaxID=2893586 RepID=A0ABT1JKR3_ACTCY|nr:DUF4328 domain-containing protein [Actinoalloteichus caeruleus]AUS78729.1 DUF4328 domain-containing protein [Actinoalloteichus sp. AHMU CJ021]MCP2332884.1 protein of unknown function (DUF4328) [Actinoalloteichus caeruleus DSM 43889]
MAGDTRFDGLDSPTLPHVARPGRAAPRYTGPPSYPATPRWGFPLVAWRTPSALPFTPPPPVDPASRQHWLAGFSMRCLSLTALLALLAAGAEGWRYALLVSSRDAGVAADSVRLSDALVYTASALLLVAAALSATSCLLWLSRARAAAEENAGVRSSRPAWHVFAGVLVPGVNLVLPGMLLAELEHTAAERPPDRRPRPSGLVRAWWSAWVVNLLLALLAVLWGFREGLQAAADGVVLHAVLNLSACVVAVMTILVIRTLSAQLSPADGAVGTRMVFVRGAAGTGPARRARPADSAR